MIAILSNLFTINKQYILCKKFFITIQKIHIISSFFIIYIKFSKKQYD